MRVPPFQSCTCASASAQRHVGVAVRRQRVMLVRRVPKVQRVDLQVAPRQAVHVVQQQARVAAPSSPRCRAARPASAARCAARVKRRQQRVRLARHALQRRAQVERCRARRARGGAGAPARTGSGSCSASFFASSNSAAVMVSKSACCRRSRSEKVKRRVERRALPARSRWPGSAAPAAAARRARRPARFARGGTGFSPRPLILGSSRTISCSSSLGSRQKASKAASNSACCSWRSSITARERGVHVVAPVQADRLDGGHRGEHAVRADRQAGRAQHAREVDDVLGDARRSAAAPAAARAPAAAGARSSSSSFAVSPPCMLDDVVLVLQQHAERVLHRRRVEPDRVQRDQRVGPVDRLGDARHLEQVERAHALHELDDLHDSRSAAPGAFRRTISSSRSTRREVDPVVQAAALQRVVDLARAVAGDDRDRRRVGLDGAELGDRDLVLGQHLEQEGVEGLVGAVELVDQQHRRARLRQRLQQRALDQHRARIQAVREALAVGLAADRVRRLGEADLDHLARDVPLVGGLRDVQPLVALHAQQRACPAPRPASSRARSCRRPARLRGTAGAAASG